MSSNGDRRTERQKLYGGKPRYNEVVHQTIVQAIREGNYIGTAAALAGVARSTIDDWTRTGRMEMKAAEEYGTEPIHPHYVQLVKDMEEAEADFESRMVKKVVNVAESNQPQTWQAAMTILERKYPAKFGKKDALKIQGDEENPIQVETRHVLDDESTREVGRDLLRRLTSARTGLPGGVRLGDESALTEGIDTIDGEAEEISD
jgi:transposase